ncbi:MAG: ArsA family ATPase [Candidatus Sericytochromatia bacterium]
MRILLYTGKGGVGKTTLSAATGLLASRLGYRTLVISTDPAHSLSDSFDIQLQAEPTVVAPKLWAMEVNVLKDIQRYWGELQTSLSALLVTRGFEDVVADELAVMPGMEEVSSLLHVDEKAESGNYDLIILDCAPTGETIRLISMPDVIDWYLEHLFQVSLKGTGIFQPVIKTALSLPAHAIGKSLETLFAGVARVQKRLLDPRQSSIRVVMTPEKMVLKEALRSFTYFSLFGYNIDAILLNRVVRNVEDSEFLRGLQQLQQGYIEQTETSFAPMPVMQLPLMATGEIVGLEHLEAVGKQAFGELDPTKVFFEGKVQEVIKDGDGYLLKRRFPAFEVNRFDLRKKGDELIVTIGNVRRSIVLPTTLAQLEPVGADFKNGELVIRFK